MKSCRVQFVVRNMGTKDKTLQINSVECKISDTTRITNKISQIANPQQFGLFRFPGIVCKIKIYVNILSTPCVVAHSSRL